MWSAEGPVDTQVPEGGRGWDITDDDSSDSERGLNSYPPQTPGQAEVCHRRPHFNPNSLIGGGCHHAVSQIKQWTEFVWVEVR